MKLKVTKEFRDKLNDQVKFIASDKPQAARKFKSDILRLIKEIPDGPFRNRRSIFFDRKDIRDMIFKGYIIVYKVNETSRQIEVFGFAKYQETLK